MEYRKSAVEALKCVMNNEKNINIFERNIHKASKGDKVEYNRLVYQIIGDILNGETLTNSIQAIKNNEVGWCHKTFKTEKLKIDEQNDFIENPFEIEEGVIECKCGNNKVYSYSKQVRSSDEPMTTYAHCPVCDSKWTYSG